MKLWTLLLTIALGYHAPDCAGCDSRSGAAVVTINDPVQSGRDALNRWAGYPWYDSSSDGLKRVIPPQSTPPSQGTGGGTAILWLAWIALGLALILFIYFGIRAFVRREISLSTATEKKFDASLRDRMESLPFPLIVDQSNLLEEARRLYQQGNYTQAIVFLFSYELVELDKRHLIRLSRGKTNRQYLREIGSRISLRQLVEQTMLAFEDAFFGHRTLDRSRFETCWLRLGEFDELNTE